ncbi:MAG: hypothetical protein CMP68_00550 [Flavobacteriales bacterium]|nr:hypothetical protein [Flavobacteriales bacterium]
MLTSSLSIYNLITIVICSFLVSYLLYFFRERKLKEFSRYLIFTLFLLRFLSFFIILFILINPYVNKKKKIIEKPTLVIFQDNSYSIVGNNDSLYYKTSYSDLINSFKNNIENKFKVEHLLFGEYVRKDSLSFDDKFSNISSIFEYSQDVFSNTNVGSYLLLSDGIYNKGANPKYLNKKLNAPLYCLALGDTTKNKDLSIQTVINNRIGFPGNELPVKISFSADNLLGEKVKLRVKSKNKKIFEDIVKIENNNFFKTISFFVISNNSGLNKFDVSLNLLGSSEEKNLNNNYSSFFIDVQENNKHILMLYDSPHPDISALKSSIEFDRQYKIDVIRNLDFDGNFDNYDLVILYQCSLSKPMFTKVDKRNIPIWFVVGQNSNLIDLNNVQEDVFFNNINTNFSKQYIDFNKNFQKFEIDDDLLLLEEFFPPLLVSSSFNIKKNNKVLLEQRNNTISENKPVCFFSSNQKKCFLIAEGIWRWRLNNYLTKKNHDSFNLMVLKIVKNLMVDKNKDKIDLNHKIIYDFGESIVFDAQFYNENLNPISNQDINLMLKDEENNLLNFKFLYNGQNYILDIGELKAGEYKYTASTIFDNKEYVKKGNFLVNDVFIEFKNTVADHNILFNLSEQNNGKLYRIEDISKLSDEIINSKNFITKVQYKNHKTSIMESIIPLCLLLILLFLEWFLRKKFIGY